ncbi:MAG: hypothetical protein EPO32_05810 [Anaerolineae bacterium]|nr:MAG: hypothetical protein EPO32_05810 [Anaerolineae bacterium]
MAPRIVSAPLKLLLGVLFAAVLPALTLLALAASLSPASPATQTVGLSPLSTDTLTLNTAPTAPAPLSFQPAAAPTVEPAQDTPSNLPVVPPLPDLPAAYCLPADSHRATALVLDAPAPDRLLVDLDGAPTEIRYIGLDNATLRADIAAAAQSVNATLTGLTVLLVADPAASADAYYVFAGEIFVNYQLIEWGLALPASGTGAACEGFLLAAETNARHARAGQWAPVDVRTPPQDWQNAPVVPPISDVALAIYRTGVAEGNDPRRFSILGDCQSLSWRLFQRLDWDTYEAPPEEAYLEPTRLHFAGSFSRLGITTASGATVATVFSVYWADPDQCLAGETPLECEFRLWNPSVIVVSLGTNETMSPEQFDAYLRRIVVFALERKVLPIIATKADEYTSGHPYNQTMAQVAYDYDIPLWNFWAAVQDLPNHGMKEDDPRGIHISADAFPIKRVTGLQSLHALLDALANSP